MEVVRNEEFTDVIHPLSRSFKGQYTLCSVLQNVQYEWKPCQLKKKNLEIKSFHGFKKEF